MRLLPAAALSDLFPLPRAIPLMREGFRLISDGGARVAERQALGLESGTGLLMGAAHETYGLAAKLVSVMPGNLDKGLPGSIGLVLLMSPETGEPLAMIDGTRLTALRTAALNACAIDELARRDA